MTDIFVSYASEDLERVKPLVSALEEHGWSVWWDRELFAGPSYEDKIEEALDAARCVVVVWSSHSVKSQWVRTEAHEGLEREILVPLLVDDVKPPLAYRIAQTAKMIDWPDQSGQLETVIDGITELLGKPASSDSLQKGEEQKPIAVLPFANMSSDPENEYFSDGISEEILNVLVKSNTLSVIARTSSFQFKGQNLDVQKIGEQLNVSHILEGSVRKSGNRVRITAQLVDTSTGVHLWSDNYDREINDIFAVQDEISQKIVDQIGIALPTGKTIKPSQGTSSKEAYEYYLQAKHLANTDNPYEVEKAIPLYEQALELDQKFVDAWVDLGLTYINLAEPPLALRIPAETKPIAIKAFRTALEIDPNNARAMGNLGHLLISQEYKWKEGLQLLKQAVALNPQDAELLARYGLVLRLTGHPDMTSIMERAYLLNPFDIVVVIGRVGQLFSDGRNADAVEVMEKAITQNRERYDVNVIAAYINANIAKTEIAERYLAKARDVVGADYPFVRLIDLVIAHNSGNAILAASLRTELLQLAKHTRVGFLSEANVGWDEDQLGQVSEIATDQRHFEVLDWIFYPPRQISAVDWARFQTTTRLAEGGIETRNEHARSNEEKSLLRSTAISLSDSEMDCYVGLFDYGNGAYQIRIEKIDNQLRCVPHPPTFSSSQLIPTGNNRFDHLELKMTFEFTLEDDNATLLEHHFGQMTYPYRKTDE